MAGRGRYGLAIEGTARDVKNWLSRHPLWTAAIVVVVAGAVLAGVLLSARSGRTPEPSAARGEVACVVLAMARQDGIDILGVWREFGRLSVRLADALDGDWRGITSPDVGAISGDILVYAQSQEEIAGTMREIDARYSVMVYEHSRYAAEASTAIGDGSTVADAALAADMLRTLAAQTGDLVDYASGC